MIDSHTHLYACKPDDAELVAAADAQGVTRMLTVGTNASTCRESLAAADPANAAARNDVAISLSKISEMLDASGHGTDAVREFERAQTSRTRADARQGWRSGSPVRRVAPADARHASYAYRVAPLAPAGMVPPDAHPRTSARLR